MRMLLIFYLFCLIVACSSSTPKSSPDVVASTPSCSSVSSSASTFGTMTDSRDGQTYKTVKIGEQVWMAQNLNYKTDSSFCYNDVDSNCTKYGRLYRWAAAVGLSKWLAFANANRMGDVA